MMTRTTAGILCILSMNVPTSATEGDRGATGELQAAAAARPAQASLTRTVKILRVLIVRRTPFVPPLSHVMARLR